MKKLLFILFAYVTLVFNISAQTNAVLNIKQQKKSAQNEIQQTSLKIKENTNKTKISLSLLNQIDADMQEQERTISNITTELSDIDNQLADIHKSITVSKEELEAKRANYAKTVRKMQLRNSSFNKLLFIFSASSFRQAIRRFRYIRQFSKWSQKQMDKIVTAQNQLMEQHKSIQNFHSLKSSSLARQNTAKLTLAQKKEEQNKVIASLRQEGSELQSILSEQKRKAKALDDELSRIIAEQERKAQEQQRQQAEARRKQEEARRQEELRKAEEARQEARRQELEAQRQEEEARKQKELLRKQEEARRAEDERKEREAQQRLEEAKRKADAKQQEKIRKQEEARKKEEAKKKEALRKQQEELSRKQEELNRKRQEAERKRQEAENKKKKNDESSFSAASSNSGALSGSFESNKGRLLFPVNGSYRIAKPFGRSRHPELKYVETDNSGIDIETEKGGVARCVFNGTVSVVFRQDGYNTIVMVRHGSYITIYANLSEIYVRSGENVKAGQAIGKIYTDPDNNNKTILHFEVRKDRTKLNPSEWVR